jgi:hypothetical protein
MQGSDINKALNKPVIYVGDNPYLKGGEYTLTGVIKRRNENKFYYQAEITDACKNSVSIVMLDDIEEVKND